jgi:hypothetical protein
MGLNLLWWGEAPEQPRLVTGLLSGTALDRIAPYRRRAAGIHHP